MRRLTFILALCILSGAAHANGLRLPAVLNSHMVLQRDSKVNIWGWAEPGERVEVHTSWNGKSYTTKTDDEGRWSLKVLTGPAGGPHRIDIRADREIILDDILLGEVWVCSGQSNMQWTLDRAESAASEIPRAHHPGIRLFSVERKISAVVREDVSGEWQVSTPESAADFSAVGYFYAKQLHKKLDVPVGMINTSWGGTPAKSWTSRETLRSFGDFDRELDMLYSVSESEIRKEEMQRESIIAHNKLLQDFGNKDNVGYAEGWMKPDHDDSAWLEAECPAEWISLDTLGMNEGVVWLRKQVDIPAAWIGKDLVLELGPIDEMDKTYVNGQEVGSMQKIEDWVKDRVYDVPAELLKDNSILIAIRVVNTIREGGLYGKPAQLKISPVEKAGADPVMLAGTWKYKVAGAFHKLPETIDQNTASVLYNAMLAPLSKFAIRGAIWYQGEANVWQAQSYRTHFPGMIRDWRETWDQGDFPFYFVQIAPFRYGREFIAAELREAQFLTLSAAPNTGMAVILDIGDPEDIHPTNKRDVGRRLALWALARDYGHNIVYSGPLYKEMVVEGDKIRVSFAHTGSGLQSIGGPPLCFEIAGSDQVYHPAKAEIDGHTVVVSSKEVSSPVAVRFAFRNTSEPNLYNKEGLPASSFCSDSWPRITH